MALCEHWGPQRVMWAPEENLWWDLVSRHLCWRVAMLVGKWGGVRCAGAQKRAADFIA